MLLMEIDFRIGMFAIANTFPWLKLKNNENYGTNWRFVSLLAFNFRLVFDRADCAVGLIQQDDI